MRQLSRDIIKTSNGGSSWMMTLADLLALIITFFVLLYSMSSIAANKWQVVSQSFSQHLSPTISILTTLPSEELSVDKIDIKKGDSLEYLYALLTTKIIIPKEHGNTIKFNLLDNKLVISLLGNTSFASGSTQLSNNALQTISSMAQILSTVRNSIEIVSYSDPRPIQDKLYPSNWELSLNRAISVSKHLRKSGYPYKIGAFGRASSLFDELGSKSSLGKRQEQSRRIDIVVRRDKATY